MDKILEGPGEGKKAVFAVHVRLLGGEGIAPASLVGRRNILEGYARLVRSREAETICRAIHGAEELGSMGDGQGRHSLFRFGAFLAARSCRPSISHFKEKGATPRKAAAQERESTELVQSCSLSSLFRVLRNPGPPVSR